MQKINDARDHPQAGKAVAACTALWGLLAFCFILGGGIGSYNLPADLALYSGAPPMGGGTWPAGSVRPARSFTSLSPFVSGSGLFTHIINNASWAQCVGVDENAYARTKADTSTGCKTPGMKFIPKCGEKLPGASWIWKDGATKDAMVKNAVALGASVNWKNEIFSKWTAATSFGGQTAGPKSIIAWTACFAFVTACIGVCATRDLTKFKLIVLTCMIPALIVSAYVLNSVASGNMNIIKNIGGIECNHFLPKDDLAKMYYSTRAMAECYVTAKMPTTKWTSGSPGPTFLTVAKYQKRQWDCSSLSSQDVCTAAGSPCVWTATAIPAVPAAGSAGAKSAVTAGTCYNTEKRDSWACTDTEEKYWYGNGVKCGTFIDQKPGKTVFKDAKPDPCGAPSLNDYDKDHCYILKTKKDCTLDASKQVTSCTDATKNVAMCSVSDMKLGKKWTAVWDDATYGEDFKTNYIPCTDDQKAWVGKYAEMDNAQNIPKECTVDIDGNNRDMLKTVFQLCTAVLNCGIVFLYLEMFFLILLVWTGSSKVFGGQGAAPPVETKKQGVEVVVAKA